MAEIKSTKKDNPMLDPVAYRSDYPEEAIIWDTPATVEVTEKYTGEGTNNVYHPYNRTLTIDQLDPNYKYGQPAKDINAIDDSYITRRNDQIASALYNEWKVTYDEVVWFLESQPNWFNSNEKDRENTKANVWNRIWQISSENDKKDTKDEEKKSQWTWEEIYWKSTAQWWTPEEGIKTAKDVNAPLNEMEIARQNNLKTLVSLTPRQIAAALESWTLTWNLQTIQDYQTFYPDLWAEVENERKKIRWQKVVDAITKWEEIPTEQSAVSEANNSIATVAAQSSGYSASMQDTLRDIHQTVESNSTAQSSKAAMEEINNEVIELKKRLAWLRNEANRIFPWDTPDYIVNAYIHNNTQEIQDKLTTLSERYKYHAWLYKDEVANAQWEREMANKERQTAIQESQLQLNWWKEANGLTTSNWSNPPTNFNPTTSKSLNGRELPMTTHTRSEISSYIDQLVDMYNSWQIWNAQCWVWVQTYYLPFLWVSFGSISDYANKLAIRNEWRDYIPQKWDIIIMASWTQIDKWHMWIVTWITADWKIEYLDWNGLNGKNAEEPAIRTIDPNSAKIQGYYNATKGFSNWWEWETQLYPWYTTDSTWYVKELWFNPVHKNIYEQINSWKIKSESELKWIASRMWISVQELWRRADNYAIAKSKWLLEWLYWNKNVWEWKKYDTSMAGAYDVYLTWKYPNASWLADTAKSVWQTEEEFWDSARAYKADLDAWLINPVEEWAIVSTYAYEVLEMFADLYNNVDENKDWKVNFNFLWPRTYAYDQRDQIRSALTLDAMINARENDIWFWSVTEWEWSMLRQKSTAIWSAYGSRDSTLDTEFEKMIRALWKKAYWTDKDFSQDTWMKFRDSRANENNWNPKINSNKNISQQDAQSWLNSWKNWWATTWWSDNYVSNYNILW